MSRWTAWRLIANRREWFDEELDHDGPACYELGIGGPRRGDIQAVYVGETSNERRRVCTYARSGCHLARIIDRHLRDGWCLYYRAQMKHTKAAAIQMQNALLRRFEYHWNLQLNPRE